MSECDVCDKLGDVRDDMLRLATGVTVWTACCTDRRAARILSSWQLTLEYNYSTNIKDINIRLEECVL